MKSVEEMVAAFIKERGVTRCPAVACAPTTATIAEADLEAMRMRPSPVDCSLREAQRRGYEAARRRALESRRKKMHGDAS
jgi:hypothetical protein